jgi:hypothetical protein
MTFLHYKQLSFVGAIVALLALPLLSSCSDSSDTDQSSPQEDTVRMNQLQYLGTHNSYHRRVRPDIFELLLVYIPDLAPTLEYAHLPLTEQFSTQGIRQIELDVFHDPEGGLYAAHQALTLFEENPASGIPALSEPGMKVLHVQEVDYETTCNLFTACLQEIKQWSDTNPNHLPIMVLVEAKDEQIPDPLNLNFAIPLSFDSVALDTIDAEIRSIFPNEQLILPETVRGDAVTLEHAVLTTGWPLLSDARGKILFALDNGGEILELYIAGHPSLEGRVLFTNSPPGTPEAAFMKINNPLGEPGEINDLVGKNYLLRTRSDGDTVQARSGDTTQREAALASGAQYISTDYPAADPAFSTYHVTIPGDYIARCNPVNGGDDCTVEALSP